MLLLEYANKHKRAKVKSAITTRAKRLMTEDSREKDRHWLLIYQVWSKKQLEGNAQGFLAELKGKGFEFFCMPAKAAPKVGDAVVDTAPAQPEAANAI